MTIKEIARELKVSRGTVDRVLHNRPYVNPKKRKRILESIKKLNYKPNYAAQVLKTKKTRNIGVICPDFSSYFLTQIVIGIHDILDKHDYHEMLCVSNNNREEEIKHIKSLRDKNIEGFLIFPASPAAGKTKGYNHLVRLKKEGVPLVLIDRYVPGQDLDYVVTDDFLGAYQAVQYLVQLGHRRIAYVNHFSRFTSDQNRFNGYKKALSDNNIEIKNSYIKTIEIARWQDCYRATRELLNMKEKPTAVLAVRDEEAVGIRKAALESGFEIPRDISLIGFGTLNESILSGISLTTVDQPKKKLGEIAAKLLLKKITKMNTDKTEQISLKPKLVFRGSCQKAIRP